MKPYREQTYYELLEVPHTATSDEIRAAYERSMALYDPENVALYPLGDPAQVEELKGLLLEAMEILTDEDLRVEYDRSLRLGEGHGAQGVEAAEVDARAAEARKQGDAETERKAHDGAAHAGGTSSRAPSAVHSTAPRFTISYIPAGEGGASSGGAATAPAAVSTGTPAPEPRREDVASASKDVASVREDIASPRKDVASPREDVASPGKDVASAREDVASAREDVASPREDVASAREDVASPREDVASARDDAASPSRDVASVDQDVVSPPSVPEVVAEPVVEPEPVAEPAMPAAAATVDVPVAPVEVVEAVAPEPAVETGIIHIPTPAPPRPAPPPSQRTRPLELPADTEFNGELLRQIRKNRNLTLHQVADRTKIGTRHLENVEADRYDALPPTVYLRGILMSLARELGVDPVRVSKSYLDLVDRARSRMK